MLFLQSYFSGISLLHLDKMSFQYTLTNSKRPSIHTYLPVTTFCLADSQATDQCEKFSKTRQSILLNSSKANVDKPDTTLTPKTNKQTKTM